MDFGFTQPQDALPLNELLEKLLNFLELSNTVSRH